MSDAPLKGSRQHKREEVMRWLGESDPSGQPAPHPASSGPAARQTVPPVDARTHEHAPDNPIILVGGGRVGRALMRKFSGSVVIETDPTKIDTLRQEFGAHRVYHGSGADPDHLAMAGLNGARALVASTNSDETNYKACLAARDAGIQQVIARLEYPEQAGRFQRIGVEPVAAPLTVCVNMITNLLSPDRRTIGEGIIGENAPTVGVAIRDLKLPSGALIVSILRGDDLLTPDPDERLQVGDVITLMTEKEGMLETLTKVTGRNVAINPLDRIYVPILHKGSIKTSFREAFVLAGYADAEIFLAGPEGTEEVLVEARRLCQVSDIPVAAVTLPRREFARNFIDLVRREDTADMHGGLHEHLFFELITIEPTTSGLWDRLLRRDMMDRFLRHLDHPVLVARNLKPYKNILLVIENTSRASMTVAHTIDLALLYGSDITALLPESAADEAAYRLLRHLKRTGRIYGVEVTERFVIGNPTLEYVQEVKSNNYDLIVVDWQARSIKRDILRRVVGYGPRSTLVIP